MPAPEPAKSMHIPRVGARFTDLSKQCGEAKLWPLHHDRGTADAPNPVPRIALLSLPFMAAGAGSDGFPRTMLIAG